MTDAPPPAGWEEHEREQRRGWLRLSYRERLHWLEQAKEFATRALQAAAARRGPPRGPHTPST